MRIVGNRAIRSDAHSKVTGSAIYARDLSAEDMLHVKILYAGRPFARIVHLNIEAAAAAPAVITVLTAKDVPNNVSGLEKPDQEVFCSKRVLYTGDRIAAVVATTPEAAEHALGLIKVEYEDLPGVFSPEAAMQPEAPQLHADCPNNILHTIRIRRGDTVRAMQTADLVFENTYHSPMQEQAFLEPEAGLCYINPQGQLVLETAGQNPHDDQFQIARALELPTEEVSVLYGPVGGAFGGREDVTVHIILALAALKTRRPVYAAWTRRESTNGHGKRHAFTIRHKWGALNDGTIVAAEVDITSDAGAYTYSSESVLDVLYSSCIGSYDIPNISMDGRTVHTNNVPAAAFRGFGAPQGMFAAEMQMSHMAELLGIDPISIRLKNCLRTGSTMPTQDTIPGTIILPQLLEACAIEAGYVPANEGWKRENGAQQGKKRTGIGFAIGQKSSGFGMGFPEVSHARVILEGTAEIEHARIHTAAADVGQGAHSVLLQIAAETLGLELNQVEFVPTDSASIGNAGAASASRITMFAGKAVEQAAFKALENWKNEDRPAIGEAAYHPPKTTSADPETGAAIAQSSYSFGAQAAELEVDLATGQINILRIVAAHNPGKAINPQQVEGQIEGGVIQAFGWTITENLVLDQGHILTDELSTYLIPTIADIPGEVKSVIIEEADHIGPFGAKGVGEVTFGQAAPAILAAVHDATGLWFDTFPLTPERVLSKINARLDITGA
jgi:CO/xanthine dehydrogenase Mo-binding subunit